MAGGREEDHASSVEVPKKGACHDEGLVDWDSADSKGEKRKARGRTGDRSGKMPCKKKKKARV